MKKEENRSDLWPGLKAGKHVGIPNSLIYSKDNWGFKKAALRLENAATDEYSDMVAVFMVICGVCTQKFFFFFFFLKESNCCHISRSSLLRYGRKNSQRRTQRRQMGKNNPQLRAWRSTMERKAPLFSSSVATQLSTAFETDKC